MNQIGHTWKRSIATLALLGSLGVEQPAVPVLAAPPSPTGLTPPVADSSNLNSEVEESVGTQPDVLLNDAKLLVEMGKLDEAKEKLERVLRSHPDNEQAARQLELLQQLRQSQSRSVRRQLLGRYGMLAAQAAEVTQSGEPQLAQPVAEEPAQAEPTPPESNIYRMDPRLLERYGLKPRGSAGTQAGAAARPNRGKQQIEAKLNQIVLNDVVYDSLPLSEVVKDLQAEARRRDPAKQGLNILLSNVPETAVQSNAIDPLTGTPLPAPTLDVGNVTVKLHLRDVRLKDVLDAMIRVADQPIRYSVEDYGVVFSPGAGQPFMAATTPRPEPPRLQVRTFRVDTNTFVAGLEHAFGVRTHTNDSRGRREEVLELRLRQEEHDFGQLAEHRAEGAVTDDQLAKGKAALQSLRQQLADVRAEGRAAADDSRGIQNAFRQLLQQLGVNMDVPSKAVFYNELTGIVMVRGTAEDLELVEAAIETLGGRALRPSPSRENAAGTERPSGSPSAQLKL